MTGKQKNIGYVTICLLLFLTVGLKVRAGEDYVLGTLYTVAVDTEVKASADSGAATVGNLQAGQAVIMEETSGSWSKVMYQDIEGYVPNSALQIYMMGMGANLNQESQGSEGNSDQGTQEAEGISNWEYPSNPEDMEAFQAAMIEELNREFQDVMEEEVRTVEEHEIIQEEKRSSMIWGIVIAILVIAIFAVGVVSAIKNRKEEEEEGEPKENKAEEEKSEETGAKEKKTENKIKKRKKDLDLEIEEILDDEEEGKK